MNHLEVLIDPYGTNNRITLNGKSVSIYSEFSNFVKEPVLKWAYRFFETAEREINDEFHLTVMGNAFAQRLFRDLRTESCREFTAEALPLSMTAAQRMDVAMELAEKYQVDLSDCMPLFPVYSREDTGDTQPPAAFVPAEEAALLLVEAENQIPRFACQSTPKLALVMEPHRDHCVEYQEAGVYIWRMGEEALTSILADILEGFCFSHWVVLSAQKMRNAGVRLSKEDALQLQMLTAVTPVISVGRIQDVPLDGTVQIPYTCYPEGSTFPQITAVPVVEEIVEISGERIKGIGEGSTDVEFFADGDPSPFARQRIRVFRENFVKTISVDTQLQLAVGEAEKLQIQCLPENAEDAGQLAFTASPEGIVSVDENGCVTALAAGQAQITVSATRVQTEIPVQVVPAVQTLCLSENALQCFVGQIRPLSVRVEPAGAVMPEYEWRTSNSRVAVVERDENGNAFVRANGVGDACIICQVKDGRIKTECPVTVESTFQKKADAEKQNLMLWGSLACAGLFAFVGPGWMQILAAAFALLQIYRRTQSGETVKPWMQWGSWIILGHGLLQMFVSWFRF